MTTSSTKAIIREVAEAVLSDAFLGRAIISELVRAFGDEFISCDTDEKRKYSAFISDLDEMKNRFYVWSRTEDSTIEVGASCQSTGDCARFFMVDAHPKSTQTWEWLTAGEIVTFTTSTRRDSGVDAWVLTIDYRGGFTSPDVSCRKLPNE